MFLALTVLFLVVPLLELWVIVGAAHAFGVPQTLVVLVLISLAGAYLVGKGNPDQAVRFYASGYYYDAKRMGLLDEVGL